VRTVGLRDRWLLLGAVCLLVVLALIGYRLLDKPNAIYYYRLVDEQTLLAGTESGPDANVRVTNVVESPSTVTITVSGLYLSIGPSGEGGVPYESMAKLTAPLGARTVVDGSTGQTLQRATCPWPAYFATVCP
jgi:hypothetical protein